MHKIDDVVKNDGSGGLRQIVRGNPATWIDYIDNKVGKQCVCVEQDVYICAQVVRWGVSKEVVKEFVRLIVLLPPQHNINPNPSTQQPTTS